MMHALRPSSLFRPSSRPTSPAPASTPASPRLDPTVPADRTPRAMHKLSLTTFSRRPSPAPAQSQPAASIVQDGHYLETLQLKLSEAVSKALAQPTGPAAPHELVNGRRAIPSGRGHTLGALIATELNATRENPHLRKAIIRSLHRPLSILLTNLNAHLVPLLNSPAFSTPLVPTPQTLNPNPTQLHALAYATFAGELLESLDEMSLGQDVPDARGDGLKPTREALNSVISRVVHPLVGGIKDELVKLIDGLEYSPTVPTGTGPKVGSLPKTGPIQHPSIVSLQTIIPIYARALSRYYTTAPSQSHLATVLISLVWHGLVALSHRAPAANSPPTSPVPLPTAIKKGRSTTPPSTPPPTRFTLKLPPSRPPSPPQERHVSSVASDARNLYDLLSTLPRPSADRVSTCLAREAVDDAFDGLKGLVALFDFVHANPAPVPGATSQAQPHKIPDAKELEVLTADMPTLVALPVLLQAYVYPYPYPGQQGQGQGQGQGQQGRNANAKTVAGMLGLSQGQYRAGCLTGFGRAEECTPAVGERVLDVLKEGMGGVEPSLGVEAVMQWLKAEVEAEESG